MSFEAEKYINKFILGDCMEYLPGIPDKFFDLAIVDPEYGIGASEMTMGKGNKSWKKGKGWDKRPPKQEYFNELSRISKKQIIFGGNYFELSKTGGWLLWDKERFKDVSFSDGELAWTNFLTTLRIIRLKYDGFLGADEDGKIHPTQKPIKLYKKLLSDYAKPGDLILDTHVGSASSLIACIDMGFSFTGFEIDAEYYEAACKRIKQFESQLKLAI
jgi:site-specific DNA-methyltransferase (adenine-specific)